MLFYINIVGYKEVIIFSGLILAFIWGKFHRSDDPVKNSIWISIEGGISSGKTKLLSELKKRVAEGDKFGLVGYDIRFIDEDVVSWNEIFKNFCEDRKRWAFTFQFKVMATRIKQYSETHFAIRKSGRPSLIISERSLKSSRYVFIKMCRDLGYLEEIEEDAYNSCYGVMLNSRGTIVPDLYYAPDYSDLYVYCGPPCICRARDEKRARNGENLDLEYLRAYNRAHSNWIEQLDNVVNINTSEEISDDTVNKWYVKISKSIKKINEERKKDKGL